MIKIMAAQRLAAATRKHSMLEKKYERIVQDALDDEDMGAEPGMNFPEPTLTLDPNSKLKDVLDVLGRALKMKASGSNPAVFTDGNIAVIVYAKGGKPDRVVVSEQSED